jgi:hypothetical protein
MTKVTLAFLAGCVFGGAATGLVLLFRSHVRAEPAPTRLVEPAKRNRPSGQPTRSSPQSHDVSSPRQAELAALQRLQFENAQLRTNLNETRQEYEQILNSVVREPQLSVGLMGERLDQDDESLILNDLRPSASLAQSLGLTEQENQKLAELLNRYRKAIENAQSQAAVIEESDDAHVLLRAPSSEENAQRMEGELTAGIKAILGEKRSEAFLTTTKERLLYVLGHFGGVERTVAFDVVSGTNDQEILCRIVDTQHVVPGQHSFSTETTVASLPGKYRSYAARLPRSFVRFWSQPASE